MGKLKLRFCLEGWVVDFERGDANNCKFVCIACPDEPPLRIKLAKYLHPQIDPEVWLGKFVRVVGEEKLDLATSSRRLKARSMVALQGADVGDRDCPASVAESLARRTKLPDRNRANEPQVGKTKPKGKILVCQKSGCRKRGGDRLMIGLQENLREQGLDRAIAVVGTGCMKRCKTGPAVTLMPSKVRYDRLKADGIPDLINRHFQPSSQQSFQRSK